LSAPIFQLLKDYLTNHYQQVMVAGTISKQHPVLSGVPQGLLLAQLYIWLCICYSSRNHPSHFPLRSYVWMARDYL